MADGKKSFIAYTDWKETFDALPDEKAGQLIKHIFSYVSDEDPKSNDLLINAVFANIKNTLKRDLKRWETQHRQRVLAGLRSAELRKQSLTTVERPLNENKQPSTDSVSVSDSVNVSVNVKKTIKDRMAEFKNSLQPFLEKYGNEMLNDFYLHWTEKRELGRKMRFEMQPTWETKRRLVRWFKNDFSNKDKKPVKKEYKTPMQILKEREQNA